MQLLFCFQQVLTPRFPYVSQAMEAEKQKLVNLRDRASELGEMKELKRIVEQLKELERPETRAGRLNSPLGIEADPKMDPAVPYDPEAEEREKKEKGGRACFLQRCSSLSVIIRATPSYGSS